LAPFVLICFGQSKLFCGKLLNKVSDQHGLSSASSTGTPQQSVVQALRNASRSGSDFAYLLRASGIESGYNANATSQTSSATGLFQFIEQTWLRTLKAHGAQYGLGEYAAQIQSGAGGTMCVTDPATRQAILNLRKNPLISAEMTCELNRTNAATLQKNVGGSIGPTELYLAHFLGAGGASALLRARQANPDAQAAGIVPAAAEANSSVFYTAAGQPRSVEQIYQHFAQQFDPSSATLGTAATSSLASSTSATQTSSLAANFASLLAEQMKISELAASIASGDDDEDSSLSILA
jgi:hypothetical protein